MNPHTHAATELRVALHFCESRAARARELISSGMDADAVLRDHVAEITGHIADALDRIEDGLGSKLVEVMLPDVPAADAMRAVVSERRAL